MGKQLVTLDRKRQLYLPGFTLTSTGLIANKSVSQQEWEDAGEVLSHMHQTTLWWIGDWLTAGEDRKWVHDDKYEGVKDRFGIEEKTARNAVCISRAFEMSRRRDILYWSHHADVAGLPEHEQDFWLDRAIVEKWSSKELRKQIKAALPPPDLNEVKPGTYRVILADPPWQYSDQLIEGYGAAEHHYPTVSTEKLCMMEVAAKAADSCVLFLWTTSPILPEALQLCAAWGFEYKSQFIWDKVKHNYGHYNSVRHELLLIATHGSCTPDSKKLRDSVQTIERDDKHSRKPDQFYEIIEEMYPNGPYLELFAREKRKGWKAWGNEL